MWDFLKQVMEEGKLTSLYLDYDDTDTYSIGFIEAMKDGEMIFRTIPNDDVRRQCYMWLDTDNISHCTIEGVIEKKYEKKLKAAKSSGEKSVELDWDGEESLLHQMLCTARQKGLFVECIVREEPFVGEILEFSDEILVLREINTYGMEEGINCFKLSGIDEIYINSSKCVEYKYLYDMNREA